MLQVAIGPVILISGVGLLLLTLTNRFGRAVDRSRALQREGQQAGEAERGRLAGQVEILYRRAQVIRLSIILAALSLLLAALLIIVLFVTSLARLKAGSSLSFCSSVAWFHSSFPWSHSFAISSSRCTRCDWNWGRTVSSEGQMTSA